MLVASSKPMLTCGCGRVYVYDKKMGHSRTKCNSCLSNHQRRSKKDLAIKYKGGKCQACGYDKCVRSLGFHHLDRSNKRFQISGEFCRSWEEIEKELDKCILLCQNCHGELHAGVITIESIMGP